MTFWTALSSLNVPITVVAILNSPELLARCDVVRLLCCAVLCCAA
jgi:hypothetical protein